MKPVIGIVWLSGELFDVDPATGEALNSMLKGLYAIPVRVVTGESPEDAMTKIKGLLEECQCQLTDHS